MARMIKQVLLTPIVKEDFENIASWLAKEWNVKVLLNFLDLYEAKIRTIADFPTRYPIIHSTSNLRKAVLTKHNIILYIEKAEHIEKISIFDTRQDPNKISKLKIAILADLSAI